MRKTVSYPLTENFQCNLIHFARNYSRFCILQSNSMGEHELIAAIGCVDEITTSADCFEALKNFYAQKHDWLFGFISYEAASSLIYSSSQDIRKGKRIEKNAVGFPLLHFFQPQYVFYLPCRSPSEATSKNYQIEVHFLPKVSSENEIKNLINAIGSCKPSILRQQPTVRIKSRISKEEYLQAISKIKEHIQRGDIYEMNYCMEFFSDNAEIDPIAVFLKLNEISMTPFSAFYRIDNRYLLCASPERFLKKDGRKIISQPIKGTISRGKTLEEDWMLKENLRNSEKDKSENVMIVDLVRNDLSRTCKNVRVEELFGIYTFRQWYQMISTISGEMKEGVHFTEVIENAFPMGSMTGAPKVSAMKLIERYERTPRGLYSGTVGYIVPLNYFPISSRLPKETKKKKQKGLKEKENDANFDFNVVIRSILYNSDTNYLSFSVGSAITVHSIPEEEYEECMIKAKGMFEALNPFYTHPKGEITEEKGKINLTESIHTKEGQKAKVSESTSSLHEYA